MIFETISIILASFFSSTKRSALHNGHKMNVSRASQMQEEALSVEIKARKDLQVALEHYQQQARLEQESLYTQVRN